MDRLAVSSLPASSLALQSIRYIEGTRRERRSGVRVLVLYLESEVRDLDVAATRRSARKVDAAEAAGGVCAGNLAHVDDQPQDSARPVARTGDVIPRSVHGCAGPHVA